MSHTLRAWLLGSPLATYEEVRQRLSRLQALAVFSSDALSSVAYAPEEIMLALVAAGTMALGASFPIALGISALLLIVGSSYYQTIHAYPSGGGAYIVAHDNLGEWPGLLAAAALLIDYVLTVAVSASAGVAAITSAFPAAVPWRIVIAVLAIGIIAWANLRGVKESGTLFSVPTYGFIAVVFLLIAFGLVGMATGDIISYVHKFRGDLFEPAQALAVVVLLRAFASGTTALTGVEAISNGIPAFRRPESENAGWTLVAMVVLLGAMFLGITFLAVAMGVAPVEGQTLVSQIGRRVFGDGVLYFLLQVVTAAILFLAANTSFADFPRLAAILARDRYLPRQLANLGDRLVFSNGILALTVLASGLVAMFGALPHRLIPLYAVGVFLSFTLSQAGMVRHWWQRRGGAWIWKSALNGLGAVATAAVLLVIAASKFVHGAWIVILLMPLFMMGFRAVRRHYRSVAEQLSLASVQPLEWGGLASERRHKVVVPVSGMHRGTLGALKFARSLSADVVAVCVNVEPDVTRRIQELWGRWGGGIPLVVLESPYRSTVGPLLSFLAQVDQRDPERGLAVVVLPQFIPAKWWHNLLHNQTARLIKRVLLYRRGLVGSDRIMIDVPYHFAR
jgi:amino acid transporter